MRLLNITARAHSDGNRIDLTWTNPDPVTFPGVRVVRREHTHPLTPNDGVIVAEGTGLVAATDLRLSGETTYYYRLFPFHGAPPVFDTDPDNRISATATAPYGFSEQMYGLLPAIYRRYDEPQGSNGGAAATLGQLQRFLDLPGGQFDLMYSLARAAFSLYDLKRVEGSLLPLLAQWIGWKTNYSLEVSQQRSEIGFAPQIYQTLGSIPTLAATVKRITNWGNQTKEFVHNVARTNQAEKLNLWFMQRPAAGDFAAPALASLNFAYEGRPAAVREADGSISFFYQTQRNYGWNIWTKKFLPGQAVPWQPSAPVVEEPGIDTHPTAAMQGGLLWLFWESYDFTQPPAARKWQIKFQQRAAGVWSGSSVFGNPAVERRMPAAVADNTGGLWLFWLERNNTGWSVKYNRHDGTNWLPNPVDFPADAGQDPRVEGDLFAMFHPTSANQRIWLFWARRETGAAPNQSLWTIKYRIKQGLDPAAVDWSPIKTLAKAAPSDQDREPSPIVSSNGNIELFWSSTRNGGWTLCHSALDITTLAFAAPQQLRSTPYSNRAPMAVDTGAGTLLVYRSNESIPYTSQLYPATQTLDESYNGTTAVDTSNPAKIALWGKFSDFQTYTYDTGVNGTRGNDNRIARDTVGLYLAPDTVDPAQIKTLISRLANALSDFMPVVDRAVFITP